MNYCQEHAETQPSPYNVQWCTGCYPTPDDAPAYFDGGNKSVPTYTLIVKRNELFELAELVFDNNRDADGLWHLDDLEQQLDDLIYKKGTSTP